MEKNREKCIAQAHPQFAQSTQSEERTLPAGISKQPAVSSAFSPATSSVLPAITPLPSPEPQPVHPAIR